jgi:hypothetical protein
MKLEYLNKQHLFQHRSTPEGLTGMAERVHDLIEDAFPERYLHPLFLLLKLKFNVVTE